MIHTIRQRGSIVSVALIILATIFFGQSAFAQAQQDELHAAIWASLLSDPRTATIPPAEMQQLVDALADKAKAQNMSAADILTQQNTIEGTNLQTGSLAQQPACTQGIMGYLCHFNQVFGFSGTNYAIPLMLLITSGLLIVIIWEMILHHRKKIAMMRASAPPWENMPK